MLRFSVGIEVIRYGLVGTVSNLLGYSIFLLITWFGLPPKLAMTILYSIGTAVSFFGMRQWVFTNQCSSALYNTASRFLFAYFIGYLINLILLAQFADRLGYSYRLVQAVAIVIIAVYFFIIIKFFVFPSSKQLEING